jgi:hypothetical protein
VNYVLLIPGSKPFFLKSISTAGIPQTAERVANDILEVIRELGEGKCVAVVTDNAANMRGAWAIIESTFPKIHCNGCGAHVMNLLVKDICTLPIYQATLDKATVLIKFIRNHQHVKHFFDTKRSGLRLTHDFVLPVPTRWYTHYNASKYLLICKTAVLSILDDAAIAERIIARESFNRFVTIVNETEFWQNLKMIQKILEFPTNIVGKFESDESDLFTVYDYFLKLRNSWNDIIELNATERSVLEAIVSARWNFIHTESMGFAYMLTPKTFYRTWASSDKLDTRRQLIEFIKVYYEADPEKLEACLQELNQYHSMWATL